MNTYSSEQVRCQFGELLERAYYQNQQFRVKRKHKPMARLVGEPYMRVIDALITTNPQLQETIEVMLDKELMSTIEYSEQDLKAGELLPLI